MEKLPISIGILSWKSGQTLVNTLYSYYINGLLDITDDITILFQEFNSGDKEIADHFNINYLGLPNNIGIGKGFIELTEKAKYDHVMILEHDWQLIELPEITFTRLSQGLNLITNSDFNCIRYRHRQDPGYPHFSFQYQGRELDYYDSEIECTSPHLLDSVHWCDPYEKFPDKIQKTGEYFTTTSRWANWTNNPCLYSKDFYLECVKPFAGDGIALEGNISRWWAKQNFKVAHGEGLFKHVDLIKYGK
jgi:hypothetical protein